MARRSYPVYEKVEVIDVAAGGKAVARVNDLVIFISDVVPGDIVDVQINKRKKNYREGYPVKFHQYSEKRVEPFCSHFGVCGGCKWQNLPYDEQLFYKHKQVEDHFKRIGKFEFGEIMPILPSPETRYYRNKLEFAFSSKRWLTKDEIGSVDENTNLNGLGFHVPGKFDKVVDVEHCYLMKEPSNKIRLELKKIADENQLEFYDIRQNRGFLRNLIVRTTLSDQVMAIVVFAENIPEQIELVMSTLAGKFPEIGSLMYVVNSKLNDSITDQDVILYKGNDYITEEMEGMKFRVGPKSFYQTNPLQAYELYKIARDYAELKGSEIVYDLYTGTGTIANFVAAKSAKVIGIEYVPEAIDDAKLNSELNGIKNTHFFAGDMKRVLTNEFVEDNGKPDVVILDPPRAGLHDDVVEVLMGMAPRIIVYVSCNPATQARDIGLLNEMYTVNKVAPVDMFPHTHHVENVAQLKLKT